MDGFPGMVPGMMGGPGMMPPGLMGNMPFPPGGGMERRFQRVKQDSVFYKTRVCHRFAAEGSCSFGDQCGYAHGDAELRELPPEGQKILESRARMGMGMEGGRGALPLSSPPGGHMHEGGPKGDMGRMGGQGDRPGVRGTAFKSRLCTRFMQKGECSYGPTCHFAHGYEDMQTGDRNPMRYADHPRRLGIIESILQDGPSMGMGMDMPFQGLGGFMLPGAPGMLPPEMMAAMAMGGMPGGPIMPPRAAPRPPPGPPPGEMAGSRTPPDSPERGFMFDVTRTPTRTTSGVPYMDRVRTTCALVGVGALKPREASQEAVEAAVSALQTGEAFQGNAYADALDVL